MIQLCNSTRKVSPLKYLGKILTNKNAVCDGLRTSSGNEDNCLLGYCTSNSIISGNAYYSIILQFSSKTYYHGRIKMKINVHTTVMSPVMFYGYERGTLTLRKQY
jgi:hypothetical protein